jgi:hypothetical protein
MAERINELEDLSRRQPFELKATAKRDEEIQRWRIVHEDHLRELECEFDAHDGSISQLRKENEATADCLSALQSRALIQSDQIES